MKAFSFALFMLVVVVAAASAPVGAAPAQPACPPTPTPSPTPTVPPPTGCPIGSETWECEPEEEAHNFPWTHPVELPGPTTLEPVVYLPGYDEPHYVDIVATDVPRRFVPGQSGVVVSTLEAGPASTVEIYVDIEAADTRFDVYLAAPDGTLTLIIWGNDYQGHGYRGWVETPYEPLPVDQEAGTWSLAVFYHWTEGQLNNWSLRLSE